MRSILVIIAILFSSGCLGGLSGRLTLPERNTLLREQLEIHSDFELAAHHRLFEELTAQRNDFCERLKLPKSDEPVHVYLFENPERFNKFMRLNHPGFPERRAFFVETDSRLIVYAQWGDRMAEDLRHEVTHGYLHAVVPNVPLWLDEGIAEYFETPRGQRGLNRQHLDLLVERLDGDRWRSDLQRLEQLADARNMTQEDYAESWAWVHFMMESQPEYLEVLRGYLRDLRRDGTAAPISARLAKITPCPEDALIEHIRWCLNR
ncbi:MAG: DUF1570 domain-containing protein [Pirellulaceae bacterium]|nr:DUF1570 domain-containing protein [Pirellulaceae bacterium]